MVTEVRQRVTRDLLGRRDTVADPLWVNRRLLLAGAEDLSARQWKRLAVMLDNCYPTREIGAAWAVKERLRCCSPKSEPSKIRWRRLLRRRDRRPAVRNHPAGRNHPDLVAGPLG